MEAMQDKKIREKINSLDSLPDGYEPSLESKWELLQAGKPAKKRKVPYFWYAAACVLLAGLTWLLFRSDNLSERQFISQQEIPVKIESPALEQFQLIQETKNPKTATLVTSKIRTKSNRKNRIALPPKSGTVQSFVSKSDPKHFPEKIENKIVPALEEPIQIAAVKTEKSVKKHRFVEVDFDTPAAQVRLPQEVQTAQIQVKFKLLPESPASEPAVIDQPKAFRLQHTF